MKWYICAVNLICFMDQISISYNNLQFAMHIKEMDAVSRLHEKKFYIYVSVSVYENKYHSIIHNTFIKLKKGHFLQALDNTEA